MIYKAVVKIFVVIAIVCTVSSKAMAQVDSLTGKVYFMRKTGYSGSLAGFNVFVDSVFTCKINEKRYSIHDVPAGVHEFSVQFAGRKSKRKAEKISIEIKPGQTYYIQLIFQNGMFVNNIYCQEVTENSAKIILPSLKQDSNCDVAE